MTPGESEEHIVPPEIEQDEAERMAREENIADQKARQEPPGPSLLPAIVSEVKPHPMAGSDPKENRAIEVGEALLPAYQKASTLFLNPEEERILRRGFPESDVNIRPDGMLYIPHIRVRKRLVDAFGGGQWRMICRRSWVEETKESKEKLHAEWVMLIRGVAVGETVTDHNIEGKMSYGDALESTEGEAVRRIAAKMFDCGSIVWDPDFCEEWKLAHAYASMEKNWKTGKMEKIWRKKRPGDTGAQTPAQATKASPAPSQVAKQAVPEETPEAKLERWKKQLLTLGQYAVDYLRENGHILPNEVLDDLSLDHLPKTVAEAERILGAIRRTMNGGMGQPPEPEKGLPVPQAPELKPDAENEPFYRCKDAKTGSQTVIPWRKVKVPFGKDKDMSFGELPKETLWWWCCKYELKSWTSPKTGKEYPPKPEDVCLRRMLDELRAFYDFKEKRP